MTEELLQTVPIRLGRYDYYKLGATTLAALSREKVISTRVPPAVAQKKPDGLIVVPYSGAVKAYIEYKTTSELRTERQIKSAITQELEPASHLCKVLVVTDGEKSIWVNTLTRNEIVDESQGAFPLFNAYRILNGDVAIEELTELEDFLDRLDQCLTEDNDQVTAPALIDPSQLARTIWQKIWINTGKEPEKCLYNVVELFVFKFLSDLGVLKDQNSFDSVYRIHKGTSSTADRDALAYYARQCRNAIHELFPEGDDGTTIINGTIFVNETGQPVPQQARLFGEVLDDLQDYASTHGSFRFIQREFKTRLYESFLRQGAGIRLLGQYFTPRNVVRAMVEMASADRLPPRSRVCDPFCGVGGFLLETIVNTPHIYRGFEPVNGKVDPDVTLVGYDKGTDEKEDERTIILAKANMLIYFSELLTKYNTPEHLREFSTAAFNRVFRLLRSNLGTFAQVGDDPYDLILTNPPYVTSGSGSLRRAIVDEGLSQSYTAGGRGTEALAIEWVVRNLKRGGTALVVVPDGLMNQPGVLSYITRECFVRGIISLPARTFYSTYRKTYILIFERKRNVAAEQIDPVFTFLASEIGETRDARRWVLEQNDLTEATALFNQFKGAPRTFSAVSRRCKVIPFEELLTKRHWMVDRWWSREERDELGEERDNDRMGLAEYGIGLSSIAQLIAELTGLPDRDLEAMDDNHDSRTVYLDDSSLFEFITSKTGWTRRDLKAIDTGQEGDVPVYSAAASPIAHVQTQNERIVPCSPAAPLLSFASNGDGSAGRNFVVHRRPFYVSNDRTVVRVLSENISIEFLLYRLLTMKEEYGFGFAYKATPYNLQDVAVEIPVTVSGEFDKGTQQAIVEAHHSVASIQRELTEMIQSIPPSRVVFD